MPLSEVINGRTKLLALLGCPVEHTVSPQLHNTLSQMLGINAVYIPVRVEPESLGDVVRGLKACNFAGFNVTVPYKEEILRYVDEISSEVKEMGSANTVVLESGRLCAYNTDGEGFARAYSEFTGESFKGKRAAILGAGGAARSISATLSAMGVEKLYILNRTLERAERLAEVVNTTRPGTAGAFRLDTGELPKDTRSVLENSDIIINTTSLGLFPDTGSNPLSGFSTFREEQIVCDVIYNPSRTKLLAQAEKCGCRIMNGMGMLFYQGILAYEKWMGIKVPSDIIRSLSPEFMKYLDR